jgi:alpha-glucosidase
MVSPFPECIVMYVQETFGDMKALSKMLHDGGFKGVWMLDPGIKCEEGYEAYDTGSEKDVWVQTAGGKHYVGMLPPLWTCFSLCFWLQLWYLVLSGVGAIASWFEHFVVCLVFYRVLFISFFLCAGECWPGRVVFPDFTQSKVRTWWAELVKKFVSNGIDGIWNDMNEPAVFKVMSLL